MYAFIRGCANRYDTKVKARPVVNNIVSEYAIKSITMNPNGNEVIMADVAGTMFAIDLRTMKNCGNFRGNSGSVRSIEHHSSLPLVASVGLDRHLRVYNSSTKRGMASVYLKQRMNKVLLSRDAMVGIEVDEEALAAEEKEAEEEEALWANLEGGISNKKAKTAGKGAGDAGDGDGVEAPVNADVIVVEEPAVVEDTLPPAEKTKKKKKKKKKVGTKTKSETKVAASSKD